MLKPLFLLCIVVLFQSYNTFAQKEDIIQPDPITLPIQQANIGRVTFMANVIPIEEYKETDFLKEYELKEKGDLNIRVFMGNSLINYLHALEPKLNVDELVKAGNYQFSFYVDSVLVYKENLNLGAGSPDYKKYKTVLRVPLLSSTNEDSWGRFMWNRMMGMGGADAFTPGEHKLKIEIRPYVNGKELKTGELIAQGSIIIKVPSHKINAADVEIQPIKPNSSFAVYTGSYKKEFIRDLNQKIAEESFKDITSIIVLKNGELLLEEYFNKANRNTLHDTRSVGKSFASALTGIAIQEQYIKSEGQSLKDFYDLKKYANYSAKKDSVTLKSLLTMSSAFNGSDNDDSSPGNEEKMYPTSNWVKFALDLPMDLAKQTGKQWDYFTAGVVVLGDIINKSVPGGLERYADEKLFKPLDIKKYKWQYTPQKVANTAGGLRMSSLDLAKFGQLYKDGGVWKSRQVLPKAWVDKSLSHHEVMPFEENSYYGYLFWNKTYAIDGELYEVYYSSGNGGNKIFIFKDQPIVAVVTAGAYNKPYAHSQVDRLMQKYIIPAIK